MQLSFLGLSIHALLEQTAASFPFLYSLVGMTFPSVFAG